MKRNITEVPEGDRSFVNNVCEALLKLECRTVDRNPEILYWCQSRFPAWEKAELFHYFLPKHPTLLISPKDNRRPVLQWFDAEYLRIYNDDEDYEELGKRGLLIVGADVGGSWVCLNTASDIQYEVVSFDKGEFASFGYSDCVVARTGKSLDEFLVWIYEEPLAYLRIWKVPDPENQKDDRRIL